jgi:CRISPR/Cas system-associated exonuclease Cas4 (RecB family)
MEKRERQDFIRASAMGEYLFCARAWWMRREGITPTRGGEAREAGRRWHERHGRTVERAGRLRTLSALCLYLALAVAVMLLLLWWRG